MNDHDPKAARSERPALPPDNIWSQRRLRRRNRAQAREKAAATREFGVSKPRQSNWAAGIAGTIVLAGILTAVAWYLLRKRPTAAAVAGEVNTAASEEWRGSLPEETADAFLAATNHGERMRWVRSPELVEPWVKAFFESGAGSRETFSLKAALPLPPLGAKLPAHEVARYAVLMADNSKRLLSLVETPDGARVDYEVYSRHTSAPWPEILNGQAKSAEVRLFVSPGNYLSGAFASAAEWLPATGLSPDVAADVLLYARRGTPECAALESAILTSPQRVTLTIAPIGDSWQQRQYQITAFHSLEWLGRGEAASPSK